MNALATILRLRASLVTGGGLVVSLLLYMFIWPAFAPADKDRRGALVIIALLALWAVCEWSYLALQRYREGRTRPGQLRELFKGALRHLARESMGEGWMNTDAVINRPWLLILGSGEAGVAKLLERAGFRRIASCALSGEAPVCAFWLSQDAQEGSVCVEVTGSALLDTEGCQQLYRWLRRLRRAPEAVLLQVGLQDLWGADEEKSRATAVQLSPALHTLLRELACELPIHIICNQLGRVEGMTRYFRSAERRPWGFRLDRPLHSEFQASLVHERAEAIIQALRERSSLNLVQGELMAEEVEIMLDFPRELQRMNVLLGAFIAKLCETFSADTRARLGEVFFTSAESGSLFEAVRHRRLPLSRPCAQKSAAAAEAVSSYFVQGLFVRVARLSTQELVQRGPRQRFALVAMLVLCALLMSLASTLYARRHRGQEVLRREIAGLIDRLDKLSHLTPPSPTQHQTLRSDIDLFLKLDQEVAVGTKRLDLVRQRYVAPGAAQRSIDELYQSVGDFVQCQAANHLVSPLLRYQQMDTTRQYAQPLYDNLLRLVEASDGKRRPGKTPAASSLGATEWINALYAIALIQRRPSCQITKQDASWLSQYIRTLWQIDGEGSEPRFQALQSRLESLLTPYLIEPKLCPRLGDNIARRPLASVQQVLKAGGLQAESGVDLAAALELEFRIKGTIKERAEAGYKGGALTYFSARDEVPFDATRAGCQQIMAAAAPEIRWMRCVLPEETAGNLQDRGVGNLRLAAQYALRVDSAWSSWFGRLGRKPRPAAAAGADNDLAELGGAVAALSQDIPTLFRALGVGEVPKGTSFEVCQASQRTLAPFRWAVDAEDEAGNKPPELPRLWKEYAIELSTLREQLTALGRPAKPLTAEENLRSVPLAIAAVKSAEQKRLAWIAALRDGLQQTHAAASWQDALTAFVPSLQKLETEVMEALVLRGRRQVSCQWNNLRLSLSDDLAMSASAAKSGQPPADDARSTMRGRLIAFRDGTLTPLAVSLPSCEMQSYRLTDSMGHDGGQLVTAGFCRKIKELIELTGAPAAPPPTAEPISTAPSVIPTPDGRCSQTGSSVLRTILDVPELKGRFVCNISQRDCHKSGPTTASKILLHVDWANGGSSEALILGTLHDLMARPLPPRGGNRQPTHRELDPWKQETRYVAEVEGSPICPGRTFRVYFDESVAGSVVNKPAVITANHLDTAAQQLLAPCR